MGLLNNWTVKGSLAAPVTVDAGGYTQFTVGGVSANAPQKRVSGNPATYLFYPGVYTFTPVAPSEYVDANPQTVAVLDGVHGVNTSYADAADVSLNATYSDKLKEAALESVKAFLNSCASIPGNQNSECPFALQSDAVTAISIKTMPTAMKATTDEGGVYTGEATFTIQGMESWDKQRDVTSRVTATVKTNKDGNLELDASGKPQFEVRFGY